MIKVGIELILGILLLVILFLIIIKKFEPYIDNLKDKTVLWYWINDERKYIILWKNTE